MGGEARLSIRFMLKLSAKLVRAFAAILGIIGMVSHRVAANDGRIDFQLDAPRQVSLGVYDAKGTQVRTLLSGGKLEAGKQSVQWDGLDRNSVAVAPGEYAWRLLASEGLKAEWVMGLGTSTAWPAYEEWVGNHDGPRARLPWMRTAISSWARAAARGRACC